MNKKVPISGMLVIVVTLSVLLVSGYTQADTGNGAGVLSPMVQDCISNNGEYKVTEDGSQSYCELPNGSTCTSEQYYKGNEPCFEDQLNKQQHESEPTR